MTPFQRSICAALRELSDSGTPIFIMHGNRDFLIGKAFCKAAGATLLKDPSVVQLYGEPVLLMHGDSLCTRDLGYMKLRRILRNPIVLFILRHLPLGARHKLARKLRSESSAQVRMKANDIVDVTPEEVPRVMQQFGVRTLVHGHTHRPAIHKLQIGDQAAKRIVLGTGTSKAGRCRWMSKGFSWRRLTSSIRSWRCLAPDQAQHRSKVNRDPTVGAGLLANAVYQSQPYRLTLSIREQARSTFLTEYNLKSVP